MNTSHKGTTLMECDECGDIFMRVGNSSALADIRLLHAPRYYSPRAELKAAPCPKHTKGS